MAVALIGAVITGVVAVGFVVWLVLGGVPPREATDGPPSQAVGAPAAPKVGTPQR